MSRRFYIQHPLDDRVAKLTDAEAHHAVHVMRVQVGDMLVLFDGQGSETQASVVRVGRKEVELHVRQWSFVDREIPQPITLGVALPKGDRQRWLVEKLVELGATRLVPLQTERSVVRPGESSLKRLRRTVIEACKQCGRNRLMAIAEPQPLGEFLTASTVDTACLLAHTTGVPLRTARLPQAGQGICCVVGPEGGFSTDELALCDRLGGQVVNLGRRSLRTETAAMALVTFFALRLEA